MKRTLLSSILLFGVIIALSAQEKPASNPTPPDQISVFEGVLETAKWAKFPYTQNLEQAKACDIKSIEAFLRFSGTVDGRDALNHAITCLELIRVASDECFGFAVSRQSTKLKSVLLDRLNLAQGKTKVEDLRKPMSAWAPVTWAALNNAPLPDLSNSTIFSCLQGESKEKKPAPGNSPAVSPSDAEIRN